MSGFEDEEVLFGDIAVDRTDVHLRLLCDHADNPGEGFVRVVGGSDDVTDLGKEVCWREQCGGGHLPPEMVRGSDGVFALLASADAHHLLKVIHKDLAVTNLARLGVLLDHAQHGFALPVRDYYFYLDFGEKIKIIYFSIIILRDPFLIPGINRCDNCPNPGTIQ